MQKQCALRNLCGGTFTGCCTFSIGRSAGHGVLHGQAMRVFGGKVDAQEMSLRRALLNDETGATVSIRVREQTS